jgi:hypothetical protein
MAWPQTPLPLHVRMYPGAQPMGAMASWPAPVEITADVRVEQGITINYGRLNEASSVDAGDMSLSIDNRAGNYTPTNPLGIYYGRLTRNTPIRISTDCLTDTFTRTVSGGWGSPGQGGDFMLPTGMGPWVCSVPADFSTNGTQAQISLPVTNVYRHATLTGADSQHTAGTVKITAPALAVGDNYSAGVAFHFLAAGNWGNLVLRFLPTGGLSIYSGRFYEAANTNGIETAIPGTYSAGQQWTLRWEINGPTILAKAWLTSGAEPAAWQYEYLNPYVQRGARMGLTAFRGASNTNGTISISFDDFTFESIEWSGFISELPTRWDQGGRDSIVQLRASGILRRLAQGATPVKSPLYGQLSPGGDPAIVPSAYWPLEDDSGATQAANAVSGGSPMGAYDVTFAAATDLVSSQQVVKLNSGASRLIGNITNKQLTSGGTGFSVMAMLRLPVAPTGINTTMTVGFAGNWPIGIPNRYTVQLNAGSLQLQGYDNTGAVVVAPTAALYSLDPTKWWAIQLESETIGTVTTISLIFHQVGATTYYVVSASYTNPAVHRVNKVTFQGGAGTVGMFVGHVWVGQNTLPFVSNTFSLVSNGYTGEISTDRASRIMKQEGIRGVGEFVGLEPLGAQPIDTPLTILRAAEAAELGVLHESGFGLSLRPRRSRYSAPVVLTGNLASGHVHLPYEPTYDDQQLRNYVVAGRINGVQGVVAQDAVSVAAEGKYDTAVDLNVQTDDIVAQHAAMRVYLGTVGGAAVMRYPKIDIDLARNTSLITQWRNMAGVYGRRAQFTNPPSQAAGQVVDVIAEGYTAYLSAYDWTVSLNGSPATPFDSPAYDDTDARYDSATTTLGAGVNATATAWTFSTVDPMETWSTTETPYDVAAAGETVTVTAMGAVSGTGPYTQAATVTRSVNGIVKAQTAGTQIQLARPARYAL